MQIKKLIGNIESTKKFKDWRKKNKDAYLAHFFITYDKENHGLWKVSYYESKEDRLATFTLSEDNKIELEDHEEIFKKEETVNQLELDEIKIGHQQALDIAKELQKKKYKTELPTKILVILQNLPKFNNIWNITYITQTFNTLNFKIDAVSGEIKENKLTSLLQFTDKNAN